MGSLLGKYARHEVLHLLASQSSSNCGDSLRELWSFVAGTASRAVYASECQSGVVASRDLAHGDSGSHSCLSTRSESYQSQDNGDSPAGHSRMDDFAEVSGILCKQFFRVIAFHAVEENRHLAHPAGAARRTTILAERRGACKGAAEAAAQRTLAGEHRSAIRTHADGRSVG